MSSKYLSYINGEILPEAQAKVSVFDRGWLYGDGVFETMRTYSGRLFCMEDHLERLYNSAELIKLKIPWEPKRLEEALLDTLTANKISDDVLLRLTVTRGVGDRGISLPLKFEPALVITLRDLAPLNDGAYDIGRRAAIVSIRRNSRDSLNPAAKSLNFLNNILAKDEADKAGADEAIILNADGRITEGTVSNIFAVADGVVKTPPATDGLLPGISRKIVIQLAKEHNLPMEESSLWPRDIFGADELFMTSTSVGIMPLTEVDGRVIGSGRAGGVSKKLIGWFNNRTKEF